MTYVAQHYPTQASGRPNEEFGGATGEIAWLRLSALAANVIAWAIVARILIP